MIAQHAERTGRAFALAILIASINFGWSAEPASDLVPSLTVTGRAEAAGRPDQALVRVGATAQADDAAAAQKEVNQLMQRVIKSIREAGVGERQIRTTGLTLSPVYAQRRRPDDSDEPRVVGYRAGNTVEVTLDDLSAVGQVIDLAVGAGANQIEGISFRRKNDRPLREQALADAIRDAKSKAHIMADAADLNLGEVIEVVEGDVNVVRPQLEMARFGLAASDSGAPVQPGEVRVNASVTVRYRIDERRDR